MTTNPSNNQLYIGAALKYLRAKKGYSQNTLAEITGMSVTTVNYIERAISKAKLDSLEILAEALDTTVIDMMNLGKELKMAEKPKLREVLAMNIKRIRLEKGLSQTQLAARASTTVSYISGVERCKLGPAIDKIEDLAQALEVHPKKLLDEDYRKEEHTGYRFTA